MANESLGVVLLIGLGAVAGFWVGHKEPPPLPPPVARFQVVMLSGDQDFLVDTTTGKTWRWVYTGKDNAGLPANWKWVAADNESLDGLQHYFKDKFPGIY